jgi:hypothetical protein
LCINSHPQQKNTPSPQPQVSDLLTSQGKSKEDSPLNYADFVHALEALRELSGRKGRCLLLAGSGAKAALDLERLKRQRTHKDFPEVSRGRQRLCIIGGYRSISIGGYWSALGGKWRQGGP